VTGWEAFIHYISLPWKLIFAFIPPRRYGNGNPAFFCSLVFMAVMIFFIAEIVQAGGCLIDMRPCIQAFCLICIGTSLPDIWTSYNSSISIAKNEFRNYSGAGMSTVSDRHHWFASSDAAIGSFAASNAANVYLGLGIPWTIMCVYDLIVNDKHFFIGT
jgi:Ca2+/Na+ antiporter